MHLSYLMGAKNITEQEILDLGIEIARKTPEGHFELSIPDESVEKYKALVREKMEPGFWNEMVGENDFYRDFMKKHYPISNSLLR